MLENSDKDLNKFYGSNSNIISQSKDSINEIFQLDLESIPDSYHYFCANCLKFPFIKFCKDRKNIRWTCSCINNKKISIKDLFDKIYNFSNENGFTSLNIDIKINDINLDNVLRCPEHKKEFKYFSKLFLQNICEYCISDKNYKDCISDQNDIIRFEDIKIDDEKINKLFKIINNNNNDIKSFEEISNKIENYKFFYINDTHLIELSEEEEKQFNKLINIIINDYKNYPNFSHFFNIKNLFEIFNIEDKLLNEKEEKNIDNELNEKEESIIIKYFSN